MIESLQYFVFDKEFWFYIPPQATESSSGFYRITATSDLPDATFEFSLNDVVGGGDDARPYSYSRGPMYSPSPKRYLNIVLDNVGSGKIKIFPVFPNQQTYIDISFFKANGDVGEWIVFKYIKRTGDGTRNAVYWVRSQITRVNVDGSADCDIEPASMIVNGFDNINFYASEWMMSAFDGGWGGLGRWKAPSTMTYFKGRLYLIKGGNIFVSRLGGDPYDFTMGVNADDAFSLRMSEGNIGEVQWAVSFSRLVIGTSDGVYLSDGVVTPTSEGFALSAPEKIHSIGVSKVRPVKTGRTITFVGKDNVSVFELSEELGQYVVDKINGHARTLARSGIVGIAWQQFPEPILHCNMTDGGYICCTYAETGFRRRWFEYNFGGRNTRVVNIAVTKESGADYVWLLVGRERGDDIFYTLETLLNFFDPTNQDKSEGYFLDCSVNKSAGFNIENIVGGDEIVFRCRGLDFLTGLIVSEWCPLMIFLVGVDGMAVEGGAKLFAPFNLYATGIDFNTETVLPVLANTEIEKENLSLCGQPKILISENPDTRVYSMFQTIIKINSIINVPLIVDGSVSPIHTVQLVLAENTFDEREISEIIPIILTNIGCRLEPTDDYPEGRALENTLFFAEIIDTQHMRLREYSIAQGLVSGIISPGTANELPNDYSKLWIGRETVNEPPVQEIVFPTISLMASAGTFNRGEQYNMMLDKVPGAIGYDEVIYKLYLLHENEGTSTLEMDWAGEVSDNQRINNEYTVRGISILPYTRNNGVYDVNAHDRGKALLFINSFWRHKVEPGTGRVLESVLHLIGQTVAIVANGYDKGTPDTRFILTEDMFQGEDPDRKLFLKKNQIATRVSIGLPYYAELETVSIEGGSMIGSSVGSIKVSKNAVVELQYSRGGLYSEEIPTVDNGGDTNLRDFRYGYTGKVGVVQPYVSIQEKVTLLTSKDNTKVKIYIRQQRAQNFDILNVTQDYTTSDA
jgi:hypothetical protein